MKCTINENNEITNFWRIDANAPESSLVCDVIHSIHAFEDSDGILNYCYKLEDGKVIPTNTGKNYLNQEYARKRQAEYPSIEECVHAILDDDLTALQEKRQAVKTKYPKS